MNLDIPGASHVLKKVLSEKYKGSLYYTAKYLCEYQDITLRTHIGIVRALEAPTKRKLLVLPRGVFKSSIGVVSYSIFLLLNNPNIRILIDSEKYENSKNFIREIKGKLESPRFISLFGNLKSRNDWGEGSITVSNRTSVLKESSITASGIGAGKTGQHYDVIIHDDMNSLENSQTVELRKKIIDHYRMNISILEPEGTIVVIGTRYAADDLIGWILANELDEISSSGEITGLLNL